MHIKEIIIDGFKSYSVRTRIENFDNMFNAITGLNGSGKSNILDAICFVMGISRMSLIRVEKIQELVYKGGNAGITKASVTIKFDNLIKEQSPQGYEEEKEITITRSIENN
jgi:structural maintenance of chromosome 2